MLPWVVPLHPRVSRVCLRPLQAPVTKTIPRHDSAWYCALIALGCALIFEVLILPITIRTMPSVKAVAADPEANEVGGCASHLSIRPCGCDQHVPAPQRASRCYPSPPPCPDPKFVPAVRIAFLRPKSCLSASIVHSCMQLTV
jgi:hypothetical protein